MTWPTVLCVGKPACLFCEQRIVNRNNTMQICKDAQPLLDHKPWDSFAHKEISAGELVIPLPLYLYVTLSGGSYQQ